MFTKAKNSKAQGDIGLGSAIGYFVQQGYTVSLPLTDSQDYDLIVDFDDKLYRVQVKTTSYKRGNFWDVGLSVKGGNKYSSTVKKFLNTKVDYVYILTADGTRYLIPSIEVNAKRNITLFSPWDKYKV